MDSLVTFSVYLIYGLAFFSIFFSIVFRDLSQSQIAIANVLPTLAVFGLIHGLHEWSELYLIIYSHELRGLDGMATFKAIKLWLSFVALSAFAWKMLSLTTWRYSSIIRLSSLCVFALFILSLLLRYSSSNYALYLYDTANQIRWIFGFGAGAISGFAMFSYANHLEQEGRGASKPFKRTGIALLAYGISAGLLTSELGIWVIFLRTASALCISLFLWRALRVFDREREVQIESRLQQSLHGNKLKELGELSSAVAHEIKTPLSSATMGCDILEKQLPKHDTYQRQIDRIRYGIERAADISQEVLNYAHKRPLDRQVITLAHLIDSALSLNQFRLTDFKVTLAYEPNLAIFGDRTLLEEVFSNLISNSTDVCTDTDNKDINISTYQERHEVVICFSDSGGGIPDALMADVLKPFFTTKPKGEGTGMGLAITYQTITQHNGAMMLFNNEHGLVAEIRLPRHLK